MQKIRTSAHVSGASSLSRRSVIGRGVTLAAGAVLLPSTVLGNKPSMGLSSGSLACSLSEDHWANLVDHKFNVSGLAYDSTRKRFGRTEIELLETSKVTFKNGDPDRPSSMKPFATSLLFKGPVNFIFPEATYRIHHPWLGSFELMLSFTKVQKHKHHNVYHAVINN